MDESVCPYGLCGDLGIIGKYRPEGSYLYIDCPCLKLRVKEQMFKQVIRAEHFAPYQHPGFESLNPFQRSLFFAGKTLDDCANLIHGELEKKYDAQDGQFNFVVSETWHLAGTYAGSGDIEDMRTLVEVADLLIIHLTSCTKTPKMSRIVRWFYDVRNSKRKPTWYVGAGTDLSGSYEPSVLDFLRTLSPIQMHLYSPASLLVQAQPKPALPRPPQIIVPPTLVDTGAVDEGIPFEEDPSEIAFNSPKKPSRPQSRSNRGKDKKGKSEDNKGNLGW